MINTHALPPAVHWGSAAKEALPAALKKLHLARSHENDGDDIIKRCHVLIWFFFSRSAAGKRF